MILNLKSLVLELTRKCNMQCLHCMRGKAEDISIGNGVIERLLLQTGRIDHLTITGGDPSLAYKSINNFTEMAKKLGRKIGHFYCLTNAKEYVSEFADALTRLYEICDNPEKCKLSVSMDQFHETFSEQALTEYRRLPFYSIKEERKDIEEAAIIDRGNAKDNGLGRFDIDVPEYVFDLDLTKNDFMLGEQIYINVFGDILLDCDLAYENQEMHSAGNILRQYLDEILASKLFSPLNNLKGYHFKLSLVADENTINLIPFNNELIYESYSQAMFAFTNLVTNLQLKPITSRKDVIAKAETHINKNIDFKDKTAAKSILRYYTLDSNYIENNYIGSVDILVNLVKLEDTADE